MKYIVQKFMLKSFLC